MFLNGIYAQEVLLCIDLSCVVLCCVVLCCVCVLTCIVCHLEQHGTTNEDRSSNTPPSSASPSARRTRARPDCLTSASIRALKAGKVGVVR